MAEPTAYVISRVPTELERMVKLNEERNIAVAERLARRLEHLISHAQRDIADIKEGKFRPAGWWRSYAEEAARDMTELEARREVLADFAWIASAMAPPPAEVRPATEDSHHA